MICQGIPGDVRKYTVLDTGNSTFGFDDNWWHIYELILPQNITKNGETYTPAIPSNLFKLLHQENLGLYKVVSYLKILSNPTFSTSDEYMKYPDFQKEDGKICSIKAKSDRLNLIETPSFDTPQKAIDFIQFPYVYTPTWKFVRNVYEQNDKINTNRRIIFSRSHSYQYRIHNKTPRLVQHGVSHYHALTCDPYKETQSYLPLNLISFSKVVSDIVLVLVEHILDLCEYIINYLLHFLQSLSVSYYVHEYILLYIALLVYTRNIYVPLGLMVVVYSLIGITRHH